MFISLFFSVFIYLGVTREFDRIVRIDEFGVTHPADLGERYIQRPVWDTEVLPLPKPADPALIQASKLRVIEGLAGINLLILMLSALLGYFLAGRTLRPIRNMIDEQNRFITDASHELNTPLTSLKTSIEVNLRDKKIDLEKAKNVLSSNLEDVNNLQFLSDELIKITQYQKPNSYFQFEKVLLPEIIKAAVDKIKPMAIKKNIVIKVNAPKFYVEADSRSFVELFVILLDNAVKYSKENKSVNITAVKTDSKINIKIEDNGIGIAKDDLLYIFDRFYRADKSRTKQQVKGYGLGLSIAKRIVDLHKGTIGAVSVANKGTIFTITVPEA